MTTFKDFVGGIISIINYVIPVLLTIALVFFLYGLLRYIYNSSDPHGKSDYKDTFLWALLAMFVLVSVWGIVRLMCISVFNSYSCQQGVAQYTESGSLSNPDASSVPYQNLNPFKF